MPETRPYSKVYHEIETHERFAKVYRNDHALAIWLRMLIMADRYYPQSAPMPARSPSVQLLIRVGLVLEDGPSRYRMRGQIEERERRSNAGRNAAAVRWRNAGAMPVEKSREEKGNRSASASPTMMGFRPREPKPPGSDPVPKHDGQHPGCVVCEPIRRERAKAERGAS